jgi:hypothetical protein
LLFAGHRLSLVNQDDGKAACNFSISALDLLNWRVGQVTLT